MPPQTLGLILHTAMAMCAVMAVANALRFKRRGLSAYALAAAFVALGFTLWLYAQNEAAVWIDAGLIVTGALLVTELGLRAAKLPKPGSGQ
ncbi:MAG: hypothetical protein ACYC96_09200 [Fimbriimonadaceae bacterium]